MTDLQQTFWDRRRTNELNCLAAQMERSEQRDILRGLNALIVSDMVDGCHTRDAVQLSMQTWSSLHAANPRE